MSCFSPPGYFLTHLSGLGINKTPSQKPSLISHMRVRAPLLAPYPYSNPQAPCDDVLMSLVQGGCSVFIRWLAGWHSGVGTEEGHDGPLPDWEVWPSSFILGSLEFALLQAPTYLIYFGGISTLNDDTHFLSHLFMKICHISSFQKLGLLICAALFPPQ